MKKEILQINYKYSRFEVFKKPLTYRICIYKRIHKNNRKSPGFNPEKRKKFSIE